jgi:hypothetical protein
MGLGNPGNAYGMVEAGKDSKEKVKQNKGDKDRGASQKNKAERDSSDTQEKKIFVLHSMGEVDDQYLEDKGGQKTEIGDDPDMEILSNDKLLAVEKGEDHGHCNR